MAVSRLNASTFPSILIKNSLFPRLAAKSKLLGRIIHCSLTMKSASISIDIILSISASRDMYDTCCLAGRQTYSCYELLEEVIFVQWNIEVNDNHRDR
jgi:hypothetical protein